MALRAKLLSAKHMIAAIDWAARIDTPEKNELALEAFGIKYLLVDKNVREAVPRSIEHNLREQFPTWFGAGAGLLRYSGKKTPDFTQKAKKAVVSAMMTQGKFGGEKLPEIDSNQPSFGVRWWAPRNAEQIVKRIANCGDETVGILESAMDRAVRHATKVYVKELEKQLGLDLIAAGWLQNEVAPQYLFSDMYVLSVGVNEKGKIRSIGRSEFYAATNAANTAAREAFYTSINASLTRAGQPILEIEPEPSGIEGLGAALAREGMPSWWCGQGAAAIGLTGEATLENIKLAIIDGTWQGRKLRTDQVEKPGYSVVLNVPKSISTLLANSDPEVRAAAEEAILLAWDAYVKEMEKLVVSRRGKDGVSSTGITGLLGAYWLHRTSSTGDPHLHIHGFIASSALGLDGKWRTIHSKVFFAAKPIAEAVAMQTLYKVLNEKLELGPDDWTWAQQVGSVFAPEIVSLVPAIEEFSGAARHMQDVIGEQVKFGVLDGTTWRDHDRAWRDHRVDKDTLAEWIETELDEGLIEGGDRAERLRAAWRRRAQSSVDSETGEITNVDIDSVRVRQTASADVEGFELVEQDLLNVLTELHGWRLSDVAALLITDADGRERLELAAGIICSLHERGLIQTKRMLLPDGTLAQIPAVTPDQVRKVFNEIDARRAVTADVEKIISLEAMKMVTTESIRREKIIHGFARTLSQTQRVRIRRINTESLDPGEKLDPQQKAAIKAIAQGAALTLITGVAGSGKTKLLKPVVDAARRQKIATVVISRNALRSMETLGELGADQWLTAARLHQIDTTHRTLVLVDEGALLDTEDWLKILKLAENRNIQVVAIGDRYQNQAIDKKAAWAAVIAGIEAGGKAVTRLSTSYRCRAWEDEAAGLRDGDKRAIEKARADSRIVPVNGNIAQNARVVAKMWEPGVVIVTVTNKAAAQISAAIQERRNIRCSTPIKYNNKCGVGDIVRTRLNVRDENNVQIFNGDTWVIAEITSGKIVLQHLGKKLENEVRKEDGRRLVKERFVTVGAKYYKQHLELAYVTTVDTAQGVTAEQAIVVAEDDVMTRTKLYTGATRSKQAPIYMVPVDPDLLPPELEDAAVEILNNLVSRDDIAKSAHEIVNAPVGKEITPVAIKAAELLADATVAHVDVVAGTDHRRMTSLEAVADAQRKHGPAAAKPQTPARVEQSPLEAEVINSVVITELPKSPGDLSGPGG